MDFTQIVELIKQLFTYIQDSGILKKMIEVAPTLFEKGIEALTKFFASVA